jgi:hypothetical protein
MTTRARGRWISAPDPVQQGCRREADHGEDRRYDDRAEAKLTPSNNRLTKIEPVLVDLAD